MGFGPPRRLDREQLREYALKLLSGRALSSSAFREKLRLRAADEADIDPLVLQLKEYGALNDRKFAENYAENRAGSGNFGRLRVVSDLLKKRVAPKVAARAAEAAYAGMDEAAMVEHWLERKYRGKDLGALLQDRQKLASVYRRLRQAGFSSGPSIGVLKRFAAEAELLEGLENEEA